MFAKIYFKHWWWRNNHLTDYSDTLQTESTFEHDSLVEAVCSLPDKYKTVIHLYCYEGYTSVPISETLQKPQSTIRNYLHEARSILREKLGGDFNKKQ